MRVWLVPALALALVTAGAGAFWLLKTGEGGAGDLVSTKIDPGLRSARLTATTARACRVTVEIDPAPPKLKLPPPEGPATEHQLDIAGLAASTEYTLTVLVDGVRRARSKFRTQSLFVERLKKEAHLDRLRLSWSTTLPVRSSLVWSAPGVPAAHLDVVEDAGVTHTAQITGLSPDQDYEITIISRTETHEVESSPPFHVKLFTSAANEALDQIEHAGIPRRILDVLWEYRHKKPDRERLKTILRDQLDPVRPPLKAVRAISREFFDSPEVFVASKLKVYSTLKLVEHLDRVALAMGFPMVELLGGFDWGIYGERTVSFGDPSLPLPRQGEVHIPGVVVDQQLSAPDGGRWLTEWRERQDELDAIMVFGRGERDGMREIPYRFAVPAPARVAAAELWIGIRDTTPFQFFELEVNGRAPLIIHPPAEKTPPGWQARGVGLDPALLVPGENVVKLRLKPIPEMLEGHRVLVLFCELRTKVKS